MNTRILTSLLGCMLLGATALHAATPVFSNVLPRGGKRGSEVTLTFYGDRLADAAEVKFYTPGFTVGAIEAIDAKKFKAKLTIAPDCAFGEHLLRVRTKSGLSHTRSFWVGQYDNTAEKEPNNDFAVPQVIPFNTTIAGSLENEDVDYYAIQAKKGQRISAEVEGIRLGNAFFDPYLAILNTERFEIASSDDTPLLLQDPMLSIIAPEDGTYIVQIRESSYTGSAACRYRLHVGGFPRPSAIYPAGGKTGTDLAVKLLGDPTGEIQQTVKLSSPAGQMQPLHAGADGLVAPTAQPLRVSAYDNVMEAEPNNSIKQATKAPTPLPLAFNGVIASDGDDDWFQFAAKKGQRFIFRAHAKTIGSPLDPVINVYGPDNKHISGNDDADSKQDAKLDFTAPADGDFKIRVRDHLKKGSPLHVYRIEADAPRPSVALTIPYFGRRDSQSRQMIYVARGNRFATQLTATRSNLGGDLKFSAPGLPKGVTLKAQTMPGSINAFPIVFEAAADAPLGMTLVDLTATHKTDKVEVSGTFSQPLDFVMSNPNNTVYYQSRAKKLAVTVVEEVPFSLHVETPKVPLVRNGTIDLKVTAKRKEGFTKAITLRNLWNPPGIGSQPTIAIPEGKNEAIYTLNANGAAALTTWHLAIMGESDAGGGQILASSDFVPLTIAEPYLGMKIEMAAVEQGKAGVVLCKLEHAKPFEGTAKVQLFGLPGKVTAKQMDITKDTKELRFEVTSAPDSPKGQHKNLFAHVAIPGNGAAIPHNIGHGGVIRIDPPPKKPAAPKPAPAKPAAKKPAEVAKAAAPKPLSRLEKLRQEAAAQK